MRGLVDGLVLDKARRVLQRRCAATVGRLLPLGPVLDALAARPNELHLELTNACNARCVFCPYPHQRRELTFMSDAVFDRALGDFLAEGGGDVSFTPIVGDALIDPKFLRRVRRAAAEPRVDGIKLVTNALLVHRFGADALIGSGITELLVSTAGFDEAMYRRVYRSRGYARMRDNVLALLEANRRAGGPVDITIGLRPDRPRRDVLRDPDFQDLLAYGPRLDFTWSFTDAGGRVALPAARDDARSRRAIAAAPRAADPTNDRTNEPPLDPTSGARAPLRRRRAARKREPCVTTFNGPIVLADGTVLACSCVAAMDAERDLSIGHLDRASLGDLWRGAAMRALRESFGGDGLNETCRGCDMYRDLELYRTAEGRRRAADSRRRAAGEVVRRRRPDTGTAARAHDAPEADPIDRTEKDEEGPR